MTGEALKPGQVVDWGAEFDEVSRKYRRLVSKADVLFRSIEEGSHYPCLAEPELSRRRARLAEIAKDLEAAREAVYRWMRKHRAPRGSFATPPRACRAPRF
jgi:hypothetical protein